MSDQDYMAFLNKANEDPSKGATSSTAITGAATNNQGPRKKFRATQEGVEVPGPIAKVCGKGDVSFYASDADEPFEAVALRWDEGGKGLPDEGEVLSFGFGFRLCIILSFFLSPLSSCF